MSSQDHKQQQFPPFIPNIFPLIPQTPIPHMYPPQNINNVPPFPPLSFPLQHIPQSVSRRVARPARGHGLMQCTPQSQYQPFQPMPPSVFPPQTVTEPMIKPLLSTNTNTNNSKQINTNTNTNTNTDTNNNSEFIIPMNFGDTMPMPFDNAMDFDPNHSFFCGLDNMTVMDEAWNGNGNGFNPPINNYKCPHCPRTFQHKSNLTIHLKIHSTSAFVCTFCGKKFARHSNLRQHTRVHTNERPFKCPHCYKSFKQQHSLADHVRTHTGEKPHKCEFCMKGFAARCNLIVHRRIHTGERPYKCDVCQKQYASKSGYNSHQKKYHPYQSDTNLF